jgi:uncharacterized protein (DUF433 family)
MALDWSQCPAVESIPGKVSGAWVLRGTRMPVSVIFENLEAGANIDDIMNWFEGLDRSQVKAVIEFAARSLDETPSSALGPLMLVLFDQGTPVPIRYFLKEHTVQTTAERGWDRFDNGELLRAAETAGFNVLVTPDKNIRYQQNLTVPIAVAVLGNPRWPVLRLHVQRVVAAVNAAKPGSYTEVQIPER